MRIIAHLDMDAFFSAVEERDRPELKGLPIVVGADPNGGYGRGVVSTANYRARKYGIRSALPISRAWRLSEEAKKHGKPGVIFLRGNFKKYEKVSESIMEILRKYSQIVEQASIDEAYLDLTWRLNRQVGWEEAEDAARAIKKEIFENEKLTCSIGIGPNKLIAKIASDFKKPDGLTVVRKEDAEKFLEPMGVRKIPGIGPRAEEKLAARNIKSVADLKKISKGELTDIAGKKWGEDLYKKARAIDDSPLVTEWEAKSVGEQETFPKDTLESAFLLERLFAVSESVFRRMRGEGFKNFRTTAITVRFADFETKTRAHTLKRPASDKKTLQTEALRIFLPFLDSRENPKKKSIRLLGVRLEKISA